MASTSNGGPSGGASRSSAIPPAMMMVSTLPKITKSTTTPFPTKATPLSARRSERLDLTTVERKGKPLPGQRPPPFRQHFANIRECPTFTPTEDEWRDPMEYMRKIAPEGKRYGICKIVPPESWSPDFSIDTEKFHFRTRKQELNFVEGGKTIPVSLQDRSWLIEMPTGSRANLDYLDKLQKFHRSRGMHMNRFPSVDKRPLDLYELKKAVESRGGFDAVCKGKKWAEIGRILGYSGKIMSSLSTSLKNSYAKWLDPYERYVAGHGPAVRMQLEHERGGPYETPSPGRSPATNKVSHQPSPSLLGRDSPAMNATAALSESMRSERDKSTPRPPEAVPPRPASGFMAVNSSSGGFTAVNARSSSSNAIPRASTGTAASSPAPGFTAVNQHHIKSESDSRQATPNGHTNGYTAPLAPEGYAPHNAGVKRRLVPEVSDDDAADSDSAARKNVKRVKRDTAPTVTGSQMLQPRSSTPRPTNTRGNAKSGEVCEQCGSADDKKALVSCASCDNAYHTACIEPAARSNSDNWHCPKCLVGTGEFGFEEGGIYSLKEFQVKAHRFFETHFNARMPFDPILNSKRPVTEDDVEREFWRLVTNKQETVEVEYGADIHSTTHGSGFPTLERFPRNDYSADPWNLNVLPLNGESLFRYIRSDISGMTVPWLYVGMVFSTFCWHNEDHYAYSANYQHLGATKTWYGIPGSMADKFEAAMRDAVPELFDAQPDLLFQLVTLLSPDQLQKAGVEVFACDQRAGEFIITFPKAYHAGFNHGFNFNEAVNFAPADWEPHGDEGIQRLRDFRRQPCFSHDMLLLTAAASKDISIKIAKWLAPALQRMCDRESSLRRYFDSRVDEQTGMLKPRDDSDRQIRYSYAVDSEDLAEEDYMCTYCKSYAYLSRFTCTESGMVACLDHIAHLNCCSTNQSHVYHQRFTNAKLKNSVSKIVDKARLPEAWQEKFDAAIDGVAKPQLKVMRSLLTEGEKIPWEMPDLQRLRAFVERCSEWVEEANNYITRKQQSRRKSELSGKRKNSKQVDTDDRDQRTLQNIRKLLDDADTIGFDCPEIANLQERAEEIAEYQRNARNAMRDIAEKTSDEIEDLISIGKGLVVEVPEVEILEKVVKQMKWQEAAKERKSPQTKTLQEISDLLAQAEELDVPSYNENLTWLRQQKEAGENWERKAKELISVENVHYAQLEAYSKQASDLPVSKDTLAAIDAILKKQREAQDQILALVDGSRNPDYRQRPLYKDVVRVMESVSQLNSKPNGTIDLEKEQRRHEDWMRKGKKLFGKSNAPLHILLQHLQHIDNRNKSCFDLLDRPRMPVEPSSRANTPDPAVEEKQSGSQRDVFCLCRRPEAGMMIECCVCHEWYHSKCLKIARGKIKEEDDFVCPICDYRVKIPRDAERPKLEQMIDLQAAIPGLPFQPDEEETIASIIDVAQDFRDHVQQYVNPIIATPEEIPLMRFYLRKIEGADILLGDETNFFRQELHRFHPIAPNPPPIIDVSHSTRKPRPTKIQKIMAQMGIDNPEDLPPEYKTKQYGGKKRKSEAASDDKSKVPSNGSRASSSGAPGSAKPNNGPQQLSFRAPLTANTFPHKTNKHEPRSPMFSQPSANPILSASGPGSSAIEPRLASPFASTSPPEEASHVEPGSLFHLLDHQSPEDRPGTGHRRNLSSTTQNGTMFDTVQDAVALDSNHSVNGETGTMFDDNMFADLTNQEDPDSSPRQVKETTSPRAGGMVDTSLLGEGLFGGP